jgi:hypothetical protein
MGPAANLFEAAELLVEDLSCYKRIFYDLSINAMTVLELPVT